MTATVESDSSFAGTDGCHLNHILEGNSKRKRCKSQRRQHLVTKKGIAISSWKAWLVLVVQCWQQIVRLFQVDAVLYSIVL